MSSVIASYPRPRRSDMPHYVRKFRLESNELGALEQRRPPPLPPRSPVLIWAKVAAMSVASTALLYVAVLMTQ